MQSLDERGGRRTDRPEIPQGEHELYAKQSSFNPLAIPYETHQVVSLVLQ